MSRVTYGFNKRNTKIVAHRGASGIERENTCPAFIAAGNRTYYGVETDIHVGINGEFIVIHDDTTTRVSGGMYNFNVEETPYSILKEIILPDIDGSNVRRDIRIPLVSDYISICKNYGKVCVLEIKGDFGYAKLEELINEIKPLDYLDNITFISFGYQNCLDLRALLPESKIQFLTGEYSIELLEELKNDKIDLDIHYSALTEEIVKELHDNGIEVNCWTVDDPTDAERLASWGVDYITSNILE